MAEMEIIKGGVGQALTSKAKNHIIAVTDDVFDENLQKYQSEINMTASSAFDVSSYNSGTTYSGLTEALAGIPDTYKNPGMNIKFVNSDTGEYSLYTYKMTTTGSTEFNNTENWYPAIASLDDNNEAVIPGFDPYTDTLHITSVNTQTLSPQEKQDTLARLGLGNGTVDAVPTSGSTNLVESGGVFSGTLSVLSAQTLTEEQKALGRQNLGVGEDFDIDSVPTSGSTNLVESGGVFNSTVNVLSAQTLTTEQKIIGRVNLGLGNGNIDTVPTSGSTNLVESGGVFKYVADNSSGAFDITAYNSGTTYSGLTEALNAVPVGSRKGGMSVKYVQTSDNKYVQARLMADAFTTDVTQWQGVDDVPTAFSKNLVTSGGVASKFNEGLDYEVKSTDFTSGTQIHPTYGDVRARTGKRCTEQYIPIPDGAKYIVLNKLGSQYSPLTELFNTENHTTSGQFSVDYCYYDSNKAFMPYNTNQPRVLGVGGGHIPTGAKYLRINDSDDFTNGHLLTFYSSLPKFDNIVENNSVYHIPNNDWLIGYRFSSGTSLNFLSTSPQGVFRKFININGVKQIQSNLRISPADANYYQTSAFYDATGKLLKYNRDIINDIPEGAVMIGCYDRYPNNPEGRDTYVRLFVESDNSDIQTEIERVTDAVMMPLARYNDNGVYSLVGGFYSLGVSETLGDKPTYFEANSSAPSKTTGLIPVTIGDSFEYRGIRWASNPSAILLALDENQAVIESIGDSINNNVNSGTYTVTSPFVKYVIYSTFIRDNLAPNSTLYLKWINRQVKYSIENSDDVMQALVSQIEQLKAKLIAQDVNLDGIMPADYQISTEIAVANKKSKNLSSLISFAVFTDSHYKGAATGDTINTYPRLCNVIKYLYNKGQIQFAMALGDNIDTNNSDYYTEFKTMLGNTGCPYGLAVGNHDLLKPSLLRNGQYNIDGVVRGDSHNDTWYYFDIDDIRFIVLNGVDKKSDDDADTQTRGLMYNGMSSYQIQWLISTLATNKKVVIMSHYSLAETYTEGGWSMTVPNDYDKALTIVEAFIGAESGSVTLDDETVIPYDFSNQSPGIVLGVLCGHAHGDRLQFKNSKFYNIWLDNSLAYDNIFSTQWSQGDMTLGTYTEVAMDIVTIDKTTGNVYLSRIGRGSNREVINSEE